MRRIDLSLDAIAPGSLVRIEDGGCGIVLARTGDTVTVFEDVCPHAGWRLSDGDLVNGVIGCPGHGWEFDAGTGSCVTVPDHCLRRIPVAKQDGRIVLTSGIEAPEEEPAGVTVDGPAVV